MDWLTTLGGETRTRLLGLVRGEARSIAELARALGITDNAVRTHIAALERDGLVRQAGTDRSTGGKPARLYELTPAAEELFPKAYAAVLLEMVTAVREESGEAAAEALLRRVGRRLGARAGEPAPSSAATDGEARVESAAALLNALGGGAVVRRVEKGWMLESSGCPLSKVVSASSLVCALAESLVAEVTGRRVEERCDRAGRPRCAFHVADGTGASPSPPAG